MAGSDASGSSEPMPVRSSNTFVTAVSGSSQKLPSSKAASKTSGAREPKRGRSTRVRKKNELQRDQQAGTSRHDLEVLKAQRVMAKDDELSPVNDGHRPDYGDYSAGSDADDSDSSQGSIASPRRIASPMPHRIPDSQRTFLFLRHSSYEARSFNFYITK